MCLGLTCHLHSWQNNWGLLHCGNTGLEQAPNKHQHRKLTLEKNSPAAPVGIGTCNLSITSLVLYQLSHPDPSTNSHKKNATGTRTVHLYLGDKNSSSTDKITDANKPTTNPEVAILVACPHNRYGQLKHPPPLSCNVR